MSNKDITVRPYNEDEIEHIECRFSVYIPPYTNEFGRPTDTDYHLVKEVIHLKNGDKVPYVHFIKNFEREIGITKESFRKHKSKKEYEEIRKLRIYKTTQSKLISTIKRALNIPYFSGSLKMLHRSPYIYGSDIDSTCIIKQRYIDNFQGEPTEYTLACFDIETDVLHGTNDIIMATISMKDKVYTAITKSYINGYPNAIDKLHKLMNEHLGDTIEKRNIQWEVEIVKDDLAVITNCFKKAHTWKPDFLTIWNMDFDLTEVLRCLQKYQIDPKDIFSDPKVPLKYRFFEYKRGPTQKVTEGGKVTSIKPSAQWHTVFTPASFYFIDAMCAYRYLRNGQGEEPSYSLDYILNKNIKRGKLKFNHISEGDGVIWHYNMQKDHPLEYVIYNVFDVIGMELLDEETTDLSISLPMQAGCSDWRNFNSQPRQVCDDLHFYLLKHGKMMGTTSDQMVEEYDNMTIGLGGIIVMLDPHPVIDNGLNIIEEYPDINTNIRTHNADLDVSASYPNGEIVFNIGKETTHRELISIDNVSAQDRLMQGINLSGGKMNAVEISTELFGMPTLNEMLNQFIIDESKK